MIAPDSIDWWLAAPVAVVALVSWLVIEFRHRANAEVERPRDGH